MTPPHKQRKKQHPSAPCGRKGVFYSVRLSLSCRRPLRYHRRLCSPGASSHRDGLSPCLGSCPTDGAFSLSGSRTASEAGAPGSPGSEPVRSSCLSSDLPFLMLVVNLGREPLPVYAAQAGGGYRDGRTVENRRFLVPWLNCNPNRRQLYLKKLETYCKPPAFRV